MARQQGQKVGTYGTGSLTETAPGSGVWRYRYRLDGRQLRATFGSKAEPLTRKQAERAVRNLEPVEPTASRSSDGPTFGAVLTEWLDYGRTQQGKRWAPRTADENRSQVENRIRPALGDIRLADLSADRLERQYSAWTDVDGLSDNSVHRFAALISSALSFAVRRRYIATAPKVVAPAATKSTKKIPTADEVGKLLAAAVDYGHDMAPAIAIAALTGARAGEVCALRWADVDLKRGLIRIDKSATEVGGRVSIKGTKTGDERTAKVEGRNLAVLQAVCQPGPADTYVIDGGTEPVNPGVLSDRFVCVRGAAHVRGVTFHSLRKYLATQWHLAGIPDRVIADSIGWKSTRMLDVYVGSTHSGAAAAAAVDLL